jgi:uncharacterized membrane protein
MSKHESEVEATGMSSILLINDWEIKRFLEFVLFVQLVLWAAIGASASGFGFPIFRQVIGFVYLAFIPGIALLRVLRLHDLKVIEMLLYSVGLSIAFVMFLGLFLNVLHPLVLSAPISTVTLMIATTIVTTVLCILGYARDRGYSSARSIRARSKLSLPLLVLIMIPLLSVLSTQLMNFYDSNTLQLFLLFVVSLVPVLIAFDKIPHGLYSLAIFVIAISLFYQSSLISQYLLGFDIHVEYYFSNLVNSNAYWNPQYPNNINAMLSIVMLGPIFSQICGLSLTWVFKAIYPLLYSLVPLGLYQILQKQVSKKISFLSCFFFVALLFTSSSLEMLQLARQQIAELFLVLLVLLIVDKRMTGGKLSILCIVFGLSLVVSHYGLSYVYMLLLVAALLISLLINSARARNKLISPVFVLLLGVFLLSWYIYTASGSPFSTIVDIGRTISEALFKDFLNPQSAQGLSLLIGVSPPLLEATKLLNIIFQFFIVIGIFAVLLRYEKWDFNNEYKTLSFLSLIVLFGAIAIPYFASSINTSRLYHITLFFLAPFCIIGGLAVFNKLQNAVRTISSSPSSASLETSLKVLCVLLVVLFLFNTRFVFEIAGTSPSSISLNSKLDFPRFNSEELYAAKWMTDKSNNSLIYGDVYGSQLLYQFVFWNVRVFWGNTGELPKDAMVYLRSLNVGGKIIQSPANSDNYTDLTASLFFNRVILKKNRIYDNGGAAIYR